MSNGIEPHYKYLTSKDGTIYKASLSKSIEVASLVKLQSSLPPASYQTFFFVQKRRIRY